MEVKEFLANLFCVFVPLLGFEVWHVRKPKFSHKSYWTNFAFILSLIGSATICTLFNFRLSADVAVNLSIVPLTIAFILLDWATGVLVMFLYICLQIVIAVFELSHGQPTLHILIQILHTLPNELIMVAVYVILMSICSIGLRKFNFSGRAIWFVIALILYTVIDYSYVRHYHHFHHFVITYFVVYVLIFNLTIIIALRLLAAGQNSYQAKLSAAKAEKLQVISQLSASVAHEIRNPITVVRGFAQLMINQNYEREKSLEFLQNMLKELEKAEVFISKYIQLSMNEENNINTDIDIKQIIQEVIDVLTPYATPRNVQLVSTIKNHTYAYGNAVQLSLAFTNIIKNAIEAIDNSGTVHIRAKQTFETLELEITDSGRGISTDDLRKLGEPYYTTHTHGTGLSLTLVYKIITELNGAIHVQSREGIGTCFTITLPRHSSELNARQIKHPLLKRHM